MVQWGSKINQCEFDKNTRVTSYKKLVRCVVTVVRGSERLQDASNKRPEVCSPSSLAARNTENKCHKVSSKFYFSKKQEQ